ncbi:MAG: SUMF1/EgtB/PvdO family nonheme iron enzyme [Candidatus Eisenbacteria bacterium]
MNATSFAATVRVTCFALAVFLLPSCSENDATEPHPPALQPPVEVAAVAGSVDRTEIGGADLRVLSAWDSVDVGASGDFQIQASTEGVQAHFLEDGFGHVRAVELSAPSPGRRESTRSAFAGELRFNAESTALGVLMLSPGLLTVNLAEAGTRRAALRSLPEFQGVLTALRPRLLEEPLESALAHEDVSAALQACVLAYLDTDTLRADDALGLPGRRQWEHVSSRVLSTDPLDRVMVEITNPEWRYLSIWRRDLDSAGHQVGAPVLLDASPRIAVSQSMPGARPMSWGSIFAWSVGAPATFTTTVDFSEASEARRAQFWVQGLGLSPSAYELPAGIESRIRAAATQSFVHYAVLPTLAVASGVPIPTAGIDQALGEAANAAEAVSAMNALVEARSVRSVTLAATATLLPTVREIAQLGAAHPEKLAALGLDSAAWSQVLAVMRPVSATLGASCFTAFGVAVAKASAVEVTEVARADQPDIVPPAAVGNLQSDSSNASSIHLTWTSVGDDGTNGTAASYDLRYSTSESTPWEDMTQATGEPSPKTSGQSEAFTLTGLEQGTTYFIQLKVGDELPNWSAASNKVTARTLEMPPLALEVSSPTSGSILSGLYPVVASVNGGVGTDRVVFEVYEQRWIEIGTDTTSPYEVTWPTGNFSNGPSTLRATAYGTGGNHAEAMVDVTLANDPRVTMDTPGSPQSGSVVVTYTVTDAQGDANDFAVSFWSADVGPRAATLSATSAGSIDAQGHLVDVEPGTHTFTWASVDDYALHSGAMRLEMSWVVGGESVLRVARTDPFVLENGPPPPVGGFVLIPAGRFTMGSPFGELSRYNDETQHEVTLTRAFYLLDHEVTQAEWREVTGTNPSHFAGDNRPVEGVSWFDCINFCNAKSDQDGLQRAYVVNGTDVSCDFTKNGYRLPTEAEWEYACRAGTTTAFCNGGITNLGADPNMDLIGWCFYNSHQVIHDVKTWKRPNAWGLYDMSGNEWEWCWDWYAVYSGAVTDPAGPASGSLRVSRGGGWDSGAQDCRSAYRSGADPNEHSHDLGFRLAKTAP